MAYFGPWESSFEHAEKFLAGGKDKGDRPVQNNTRLRRIDDDTIALVYHETAVVTYHRDGKFTIYGGGWDTVTTKARISEHSPVRPYSSGGQGSGTWAIGTTGALTPPRVQKCRTCKGRGRWMETDWCRPWWGAYCQGGSVAYDVPFPSPYTHEAAEAWHASRREIPCEHGQTDRHLAEPCTHAMMGKHSTGESERVCHRCKGEGRVDYGSNPVPFTVSAGEPFVVDANGTFLHTADSIPFVAKPYEKYGFVVAKGPKSKPAAQLGSQVADRLAAVLPGMNANVNHPAGGGMMRVREVIVSLNDTHRWTRERIADWLDTLSVDLTFPG